jgi:hypothetical protein
LASIRTTKANRVIKFQQTMNNMPLHTGEWVEVRSKEEILKTLDKQGQLEGLPFMPQMFEYCGKQFRVYKRAHKTCDTVNDYKGRRMKNAVHLEGSRCDGGTYGGCEAGCLIFWKEAWLKRVAGPSSAPVAPNQDLGNRVASGCREGDVWAGTKTAASNGTTDDVYVCQATQVPAATEPLPWWSVRQYVEDFTSGNVGLNRMACGFIYMGYNGLVNAGIGAGRALRWLYDVFQGLRGAVPYPRRRGKILVGAKTPHAELNLQPGELIRVRSYKEILATLDENNKNRGLYFDAEMVPYCGRSFRVLKRVKKIINEKTGKMMEFKNPCIILEGVVCQSRYSECRLFCPRSIYAYWREIWLERISEIDSKVSNRPAGKSVHDRAFEPSGPPVCAADHGRDQFSRLRDAGAIGRKPECGSCARLVCTRTELALPAH